MEHPEKLLKAMSTNEVSPLCRCISYIMKPISKSIEITVKGMTVDELRTDEMRANLIHITADVIDDHLDSLQPCQNLRCQY